MTRKDLQALSLEQIRYLLVEKRRARRNLRLEHFRRTGRVIPFANEPEIIDTIESGSSFGHRRTLKKGSSRRTLVDHVLLVLEILALAGFLSIVVNSFSALGVLNRNVASAFEQPAAAPTPLIREVVLPDGHTPPNSPGGARPNEAEVPAHLRPVWQASLNIPTPLPMIQQAIRIQIPAIGVDAPVVQGDGWEQLKKGVAQHIGTPNPGENGNIVLSGHNDVYGEVFRYLDRLNPGDKVILFTNQRQYTYVITGSQMVEPTAVEVMAPTPDARVTLISCHPYLVDIHRIVVSAILQNP